MNKLIEEINVENIEEKTKEIHEIEDEIKLMF